MTMGRVLSMGLAYSRGCSGCSSCGGRSAATASLFEFLERGAHVAGNCAPRDFHRHDGCGALQKRDHENAHHIEEGMFFLGRLGHVGGDRTDQSVAQQNAQKGSDQGGGNFVSNFLRWTAESTHRDHDAKDSGDNAQTRQGIGYGAESGGGRSRVLMMHLKVKVEHLVEIEGVDAGNGHAERVADEIANVVVLEECRVLREDSTLVRLFDVGFQSHQAVFTGLVEQVIHHLQGFDIGLLAELGAAEDAADSATDLLEDVERIRDKKGADRGSADDDQLSRLNENAQIAVLHEVARHHATEDDDDADNREHC